jgi:hypothetical protein
LVPRISSRAGPRATAELPKWWADLLLNAHANRRYNFYFLSPENEDFVRKGTPWKSLYHDSGFSQVTCPPDTTLSRKGGKIVLRVGKESVQLPEELFSDYRTTDGGVGCSVSALISPSRYYVAVHQIIGDYRLACVDRQSSKVLWKSVAWGSYWGGLGGFAEQWVTVTEQDNRVVVFGCGLGIHWVTKR